MLKLSIASTPQSLLRCADHANQIVGERPIPPAQIDQLAALDRAYHTPSPNLGQQLCVCYSEFHGYGYETIFYDLARQPH